jgi:hypothetical protein
MSFRHVIHSCLLDNHYSTYKPAGYLRYAQYRNNRKPNYLVLLLPNTLFLIVWLSNLSILSVPDEGYSRNAPCALYIISTLLLKVFGSNKTKEEVRINN